jgi:hypothetical protein
VSSEKLNTPNFAGSAVLIGFLSVGFVNVFVFWRGVRCRLPESDAVRNVSVRGEGILPFNQRRSEVAKQYQRSEESINDNNGLPRDKYQHESTSWGLRATCNSKQFYRRILLLSKLKMCPPFVHSANLFCKTDVFAECSGSYSRQLSEWKSADAGPLGTYPFSASWLGNIAQFKSYLCLVSLPDRISSGST